jgi:hypothetical protein
MNKVPVTYFDDCSCGFKGGRCACIFVAPRRILRALLARECVRRKVLAMALITDLDGDATRRGFARRGMKRFGETMCGFSIRSSGAHREPSLAVFSREDSGSRGNWSMPALACLLTLYLHSRKPERKASRLIAHSGARHAGGGFLRCVRKRKPEPERVARCSGWQLHRHNDGPFAHRDAEPDCDGQRQPIAKVAVDVDSSSAPRAVPRARALRSAVLAAAPSPTVVACSRCRQSSRKRA